MRAFSRCSKQGLLSSCNAWASHHGGLLLVQSMGSRAHSFSSCGTWPQWLLLPGSRIQAQRCNVGQWFSCPKACGIFPDQGSNSCPSHWQADSLPLSSQGSPIYTFWNVVEIKGWQPTPVFLPGKSHGQKNLVGSSPQGCKESGMTEAT